MKIYEKVVIDIETGKVLEEVSYDYDGPIAQCQTTTTCPCPSFDPHPIGYLTTNLTNANAIGVKGDYAFVGLGGGQQEFVVVDVSDRTNPTYVTKLDVSDGIMSSSAWVYIKGNYAYLVGTSQYLQVIDISNPLSPSKVYDLDLSVDVPDYSIGLRIVGRGNYIYVSGGSGLISNRFIVVDISIPNIPSYVTHEEVYCRGAGINEDTGTIYVCGGNDSELTIFEFDSTSLITTGFVDSGDISDFTGALVQGVAYGDGDYLYVNAWADHKLLVLDVSNPVSVSKIGQYSALVYHGYDLTYWCDRLFVPNDATGTGSDNGLGIFDVSTPASPSFSVVTYSGVDTPTRLTLQICTSNYIYLTDNHTDRMVIYSLDAIITTTTVTTTTTTTTTSTTSTTTTSTSTTTTITTTSTTFTWPPGDCVEPERSDPRWEENYIYSGWPQEFTFQSDHDTRIDHCGTFMTQGSLGYYPGDFVVDMRFEVSRTMKNSGVDRDYIGLAVNIENLKTVTIVLTCDTRQKARRLDSDGCVFSEAFGTNYNPTEVWLRVSRTNSDFRTYYSYDRIKWYEITVASPQTYSGLVTVHFGAYHRSGGQKFDARYQFWTLWPDGPDFLESGAYLPHPIESDNFDDNTLDERWFKRHGTYFNPTPVWAEGCIWEEDQVLKVQTSPEDFHGPYNEFNGTWAWQDVKGYFNLTVKVNVNPGLMVDGTEMGVVARELAAEGEPTCRVTYVKEGGNFYFKRVDVQGNGSSSETAVVTGSNSTFWLGLRWYKDGFTTSYSLNGVNWNLISAPVFPISPTNWLQVGCAASGWVSTVTTTTMTAPP